MPANESTPASPPLPHAWIPTALGFGAACVALIGAAILAGNYLASRPVDLRGASMYAAQEIQAGLVSNRVPEASIRVVEELRKNAAAEFHYFEYDVKVPGSIDPAGLQSVLRRQLQKSGVSAIASTGASGEPVLELSLAQQPIGYVRLHPVQEEAWRSWGAPTPTTAPEPIEDPPVPVPPPAVEPEDESVREIAPPEPDPVPLESENGTSEGAAADPSAEGPSIEAGEAPLVEAGWIAPAALALAPESSPLPSAPPGQKRVAIILDDGGYGGETTERILGMDPRLTLSILPYTPAAADTATRAVELGFEVMLHMPMENSDPNLEHEGQLNVGMSSTQIGALTQIALELVPGATGINNHTGSKFTADGDSMEAFFQGIAGQPLFFVDSRTVGDSRAYDAAKGAGVPADYRDIFLDHAGDVESIRKQFESMMTLAQTQGDVVAIGHFRKNTIDVLEEMLPKLEEAGIELVHASELVQ